MSWISTFVPVALGALLGGAVGSGVTLALVKDDADETTTVGKEPRRDAPELPADDDFAGGGDAELGARVASLERKVTLLTAAAMARGGSTGGDAEDTDGAGPELATDVADPVFEAAVMDIVDRVEKQQDEERRARRAELRQQIATRYASWLGDEFRLTETQKNQVAEVIQAHYESLRSLRDDDNPDRPVTRGQWRERMRQMQRDSEQRLAQVLTPEQMRQYQELEDDDKLGGFGGSRRGGRGERGERGERQEQRDGER